MISLLYLASVNRSDRTVRGDGRYPNQARG